MTTGEITVVVTEAVLLAVSVSLVVLVIMAVFVKTLPPGAVTVVVNTTLPAAPVTNVGVNQAGGVVPVSVIGGTALVTPPHVTPLGRVSVIRRVKALDGPALV
jgi:Mn2+/Fe2+ NRAMP family transporter